MTALQAAMAKKFEHRVYEAVAEKFPNKISELGRERALQTIRTGIRNAQSHAITGEEDVIAYVLLMFEFGPDFETSPELSWTGRLLQDPDIPADARMELLMARLDAERASGRSGSS
jgi:hypothetical protein